MSEQTTQQTTEQQTTTQQTAPDTITLTKAELEAQIQARINAAVGSNSKKLKADIEAEAATIKAELQAYKQKELEEKGRYAESLKLQEQSFVEKYEPLLKQKDEQISTLSKVVRDATVGAELVNAAQQGNAVNPREIARLLDGYVKDKDTVVDEAGNQRFVAGKPMTPSQLVQEYLTQNPHHVKSTQPGPGPKGQPAGGGATELETATSALAALEAQINKMSRPIPSDILTKHRALSTKVKELRQKVA